MNTISKKLNEVAKELYLNERCTLISLNKDALTTLPNWFITFRDGIALKIHHSAFMDFTFRISILNPDADKDKTVYYTGLETIDIDLILKVFIAAGKLKLNTFKDYNHVLDVEMITEGYQIHPAKEY